ncbi:MAG: Na/Pi cotransporter family protein [Bacillota bacterium]|nr:Na/Pi cotransporter family protein [Bacillota bacterium]
MSMLIGLLGGLALFLFGMTSMSDGLKNAAGARMQSILSKVTSIPILGILIGALVTLVIQSSSATTVMVVSFVNASLMNLTQAISVILGANIGTTITAQLIAFNLSDYYMIFIIIGFFVTFIAKKASVKYVSQFVFGFGILLMGLSIMSSSMSPLKDDPTFARLIVEYGDNALLGLLIGMVLTMIIQSSSATIGILIALSFTTALPLNTAIAVVLGLNIGTCATTLISSIGTNIAAKRAAIAHLIFNVVGALLCLIILPWFTDFIAFITPTDSLPQEIANAHTIFNIMNTVIFYPFIGMLARLVTRILPDKTEYTPQGAKYLDKRVLETPAMAINLSKQEMNHLGQITSENLTYTLQCFLELDTKNTGKIFETEKLINTLTQEITEYLAMISRHELTNDQSEDYTLLLHTVNDIERIGDHAENIAELLISGLDSGMKMSDTAREELAEMQNLVTDTVRNALEAFEERNTDKAQIVLEQEENIDRMESSLRKTHINRLSEGRCQPHAGIIFLDVINNLERIGDHAANIAKIVRDIHQ